MVRFGLNPLHQLDDPSVFSYAAKRQPYSVFQLVVSRASLGGKENKRKLSCLVLIFPSFPLVAAGRLPPEPQGFLFLGGFSPRKKHSLRNQVLGERAPLIEAGEAGASGPLFAVYNVTSRFR